MYKEYKTLVYTPSDLLVRFCKVNLSKAENSACTDLFSKNLFSRPNLLWSRAIKALKCDRRWLLFFGVHIRLSTQSKVWFTLGLFANYFRLKSLSLSLKSHMSWMCCEVNWFVEFKFIFGFKLQIYYNGSFAFSPG